MDTIDPNEFYTPNQVAEMGLIKAPSKKSRKQLVLRHIRNGVLTGKNVGNETQPRYLVQGKDIIIYSKRKDKK